ncbi:hypothetical protein BWI17_01800 [Betaproteobacteria bacterium GR16-43]|nr:hypothetical protein BWI17_01800 [Betaproteobacteria bacterium GR16-43]
MRPIFSLYIAALACIASLDARADVIPLPGSSPQRAVVGQVFQPISVLVTDQYGSIRPYVEVSYLFSSALVSLGSNPASRVGCENYPPHLSWRCATITDAQGIARLHDFTAVMASTQPTTIELSVGIGGPFTRGTVQLFTDSAVPVMKLNPVGTDQAAPVRTVFAQPFGVRVTSPDGQPVSGLPVSFKWAGGTSLTFTGGLGATVVSDADGNAAFAAMAASGIGPGIVRAEIFDPIGRAYVTTDLAFRTLTPDGRTDSELEDMWWAGFQENGWGLSIAQREDRLFSVLYVYDDKGNPTWEVLESGSWYARYENYVAYRYSPRGSPYYAYKPWHFDIGPRGRDVSFNFSFEGTATMAVTGISAQPYNLDAPSPVERKKLTRQDFRGGTPAPLVGIGGMWWGGASQGGWGISLMQQYGGLFSVWFTYDEDSKPTWFVMPEGQWENANTYSGPLYKTKGSPVFFATYDPSKFQIFPVGTFRFRFSDLDHGTFEYNAEGHTGSMAIERQLF